MPSRYLTQHNPFRITLEFDYCIEWGGGGTSLGPFSKHSLMDELSTSGRADPSKTTRSFVVSLSDFNTPWFGKQ